jgi:hypothetical protein
MNRPPYEGQTLNDAWLERMVSFDEAVPFRQGAWTSEEFEYVTALVDAFHNGLLVIDKGTKLRSFLAKCVHCGVKRISKKMEKSDYHGRCSYLKKWDLSDTEIKKTEHVLLDLKSRFKKSVQQTLITTDDVKANGSPPSLGLKKAVVPSTATCGECMPTLLSNLGTGNPEASRSSLFNGTLNRNANLSASSASQQLSAYKSAKDDIGNALLAASKNQATQWSVIHPGLVSTAPDVNEYIRRRGAQLLATLLTLTQPPTIHPGVVSTAPRGNEDIRRRGAQLLATCRSVTQPPTTESILRARSLHHLALSGLAGSTHAPSMAHRVAVQAHAAGFPSSAGSMLQGIPARDGTSATLAASQVAVGPPCTQVKSASPGAWSWLVISAATTNTSSVAMAANPSASLPDATAAAGNKRYSQALTAYDPFIAEEAANKRRRFHY